MAEKFKIFIASSTEQKEVAEEFSSQLADEFEMHPWYSGSFDPSEYNLVNLCRKMEECDFAIFLTAPDDLKIQDGEEYHVMRDNVLFELGLGIGYLNRERCFLLAPKESELQLPTDLKGLYPEIYTRRQDGLLDANYALLRIKKSMRMLGQKRARWRDEATGLLETACRALATPHGVYDLGCRAFVFKHMKQGNKLVCKHEWSSSFSQEVAGRTNFQLGQREEPFAVERAFFKGKVEWDEPSPNEQKQTSDENGVSPYLTCVIAAPIWYPIGEVWGVVSIDVSTKLGANCILNEISDTDQRTVRQNAVDTIRSLSRNLSDILYRSQK